MFDLLFFHDFSGFNWFISLIVIISHICRPKSVKPAFVEKCIKLSEITPECINNDAEQHKSY